MRPAARGKVPEPARAIGPAGLLPRVSRAKVPATKSQGPQVIGGSGGSLPRVSRER